MLELFALLSTSERSIFACERRPDKIVELRKKLENPVWEEIRKLAQSVIDAENKKSSIGCPHRPWPKKSPLYKGAGYIVRNFPELTAYLDDPTTEMTNNRSERLLRSKKILLVSAKVSKIGGRPGQSRYPAIFDYDRQGCGGKSDGLPELGSGAARARYGTASPKLHPACLSNANPLRVLITS